VDAQLDLAVFTFDEISFLESWRFVRFSPNGTRVQKSDIVHFIGFPGDGVRAGASQRTLNYCFSSQTIHDVSHSRFLLHSAPGSIHHKDNDGKDTDPFRIRGASGAPVFKVEQDFQLSLAGIISDLSSSGLCIGAVEYSERYELSDGDIYITHCSFIQENGTILR
jgi:hypothetical protein